jgi:hypothetical protein
MKEFQLTGGARIGSTNITFPFATLKVNKDQLELNASIVGNLVFQTSDIVSIEPYTMFPILGQGIKINHTVDTYKGKVIFWTFNNPKSVVQKIRATGFLNHKDTHTPPPNQALLQKQAQGGFAIKKGVAIAIAVIWNLLFLVSVLPFFLGSQEGASIGIGILTAFVFVGSTALLSLISPGFRRLILKEGRGLDDIKQFAIFIVLLCGFMFYTMYSIF